MGYIITLINNWIELILFGATLIFFYIVYWFIKKKTDISASSTGVLRLINEIDNIKLRQSISNDDITKYLLKEIESIKVTNDKYPTSQKKIEDIIEEKKSKFTKTPSVAFHFVNAEQIKSFYADYFKEPTLANLVSEITGEISADIKGNIPQILESKIGGKDISKWVSTIKLPDASLSGMFLRYQRETIKNNQVVLGIEEVEIELNEIQEFENTIKTLTDRFDFQPDDSMVNSHKTKLKEKAAERTLVKLEQATGWVLIEGRFKIEVDGNFYRCIYTHPVSQYLSEQANAVSISISLPIGSIEPSFAGNYASSIGKMIPLKVYGQVWQPIDRKSNSWQLQLTPLAVY